MLALQRLFLIILVWATGATAQAQCPNYSTDPPGCYDCPQRYEPAECLTCNTASKYVGEAPECFPCLSADDPTPYCDYTGTRTADVASSTTCTCNCRNGYRGTKCETCPENFKAGSSCGQCKDGYSPYPPGNITSTSICSPLCTTANCSWAGTPRSGDTYAAGCPTCICGANRDPATRCATCFAGFDLSNNCQTCLTGYDAMSGKCYKQCRIAANCTLGNTGAVSGNEYTGCVCFCNGFWTGKTCQTCAPMMSPTCTACIAGYEAAPNCTKTCTVADCANHATAASGNYRTGCLCRCQDYWYGVSVGGGLSKNCTSCPSNFNANCDQCITGYQLNSGTCKELCTNADCNNRSTQVSGLKGNCSCECSNAWAKPYCATCPARFAGSDCNECNVGYVEFPMCIRNCTNEVDCNLHASTVQGFTNGTCSCTCRNGWTGAKCATCPYRYDRDNYCTGCNSTTHEGLGLQCYPKCTVARNCSNHAYNVSGNDNMTCHCSCQNEWTDYTCNTCPAKYNATKNCGECKALYEKYPYCYLKCTNVANCTGRATNVTGNVNDGCNCFCNAGAKWTGPKCDICPSNYLQTTCSSCAANYTKYPNCYLLCSNANCSNNAVSWSGDTSTGCTCTCKDKWQGTQCNICPAGVNLTDNCRTCNAGFVGPLCEQLCTSANDCSGHASNVTGYVGNCTCKCATNWYGGKCDQCPANYNTSLGCGNCSKGYDSYPACYLTCTNINNCSNHSTAVSGNANTGCYCTCRNEWFGTSCDQCPPLYDSTKDCETCIPGWSGFPNCQELCTNATDCTSRATAVSGYKGYCACACGNSYNGSSCGICASIYDLTQDCSQCADGYDTYPLCALTCNMDRDCSGHATNVTGNYATGCVCSCRNEWTSANCSVCDSNVTADCASTTTSTTSPTSTTASTSTTTTSTTSPTSTTTSTSTTSTTSTTTSTTTATSPTTQTPNVCLGKTELCSVVHLISGAATSRATCHDSLSQLNPSFSSIPNDYVIDNSSLFFELPSSAPAAAVSMYNLNSMADYRLISFVANYQQSRNEVSVAAKDLTNETQVMGIRAHSNFTTAIDVAIKVYFLQWDGVMAKGTAMASGINVTFTESCGWPSNGSSYSRIIAIERPVVYLPRKIFEMTSANKNLASVSAAVTLTVGAVALPIAAIQQGVALSLVRMAKCGGDSLDGSMLDPSVHPLRFGLGDGITKYARGSVLGNLLIIPCVWAVLWYLAVSHVVSAWRKQSLPTSREFIGWPGIAITPFSILSEGSAMACVALLFNASNSALDAVMGSVGLALLLASMVAWVRSLWLLSRLKSRSLECLPVPSQGILRFLIQDLKPRYEWELVSRSRNSHLVASSLPPEDPLIAKQETIESDAIAASYLECRLAFIGDSWWLWSQVAASALSVAVGVAEGLSLSDKSQCKTRWVLASAAAILQGIVILTNTILAEVALLGIICLITFGLIIAISLSTFGVTEFSGGTFDALNALGIANSIVAVALMVLGIVVSVLEANTKASKKAVASSLQSTTLASFWGSTDNVKVDQELTQMPTLLIESDSDEGWQEDSRALPPTAEHGSKNSNSIPLKLDDSF